MSPILDRFPVATTQFQPKTPGELFALHLATKLGDTRAVHHYAALVEAHSELQLLAAYRRTVHSGTGGDLGRRFHEQLQHAHANGHHNGQTNLIAIRIERRTVAAAIFAGTHLEYADSRQLASARDKALASAVGFINWLLDRFSVESAAVESVATGQKIQRLVLHKAICTELRAHVLPIWEVQRKELLAACAYPALKSRGQLRVIATSVWPILAGTRAKVFIQDTAMLGLYVQIERLFLT